jgi:hypothetical protein
MHAYAKISSKTIEQIRPLADLACVQRIDLPPRDLVELALKDKKTSFFKD